MAGTLQIAESGCAQLRAIALDCGAPAIAGALNGTVDQLAADLEYMAPPQPAEYEALAVSLAAKFGLGALGCAAEHLIKDAAAGALAGPAVGAAPCHRCSRAHIPFLEYIAKRARK